MAVVHAIAYWSRSTTLSLHLCQADILGVCTHLLQNSKSTTFREEFRIIIIIIIIFTKKRKENRYTYSILRKVYSTRCKTRYESLRYMKFPQKYLSIYYYRHTYYLPTLYFEHPFRWYNNYNRRWLWSDNCISYDRFSRIYLCTHKGIYRGKMWFITTDREGNDMIFCVLLNFSSPTEICYNIITLKLI